MTDIDYEIVIGASPEVVFAHLTEEQGLVRWMAVTASADPVPGGELRWTHENGATMIGDFVEVDRPHRVVFRYGWEGDLMGVPPASTTVEIQLTPTAGGTRVALTHRDLPADTADDHLRGWDHFLGQLANEASALDAPPQTNGQTNPRRTR